MIIQKTFRYRLEPNAGQRQRFARFAGCCRFIFNRGLAARMDAYEQVPSPAAILERLGFGLSTFLRVKKGEKPGFPRFKKKGLKDSATGIPDPSKGKCFKSPSSGKGSTGSFAWHAHH